MQFVIEYNEKQYLVALEEIVDKEVVKGRDKYDMLRFPDGDNDEDCTKYLVDVFHLEGQQAYPKPVNELEEAIKQAIIDIVVQTTPKVFVGNPYFDELMMFFKNTIFTSQDKFKPITCDQCGKPNLYEKRDKANKSDFINRIQAALSSHRNEEWPFEEDLLIQFTVSNKQSILKSIDLDNLAKSLFDAFQGVVFKNDSQIIAFASSKESVIDAEAFIVAIRRLAPNEKPIFQEFLFSGCKRR